MKILPIFFLTLALQAQTPNSTPNLCTGTQDRPLTPDEIKWCNELKPPKSCDATDWKARAEWLEQKLAATEAKTAALANFYAAQEQLTGLAAKEPPKPKPDAPRP